MHRMFPRPAEPLGADVQVGRYPSEGAPPILEIQITYTRVVKHLDLPAGTRDCTHTQGAHI